MPPSPLKLASTAIKALDTAITVAERQIGRSIPPARRATREMSATLSALKGNTSPALIRGTAPTTRRQIRGNVLPGAQPMSAPSTRQSATPQSAIPTRHSSSARHHAPSLPGRTPQTPQSNSALQQALTQSRLDAANASGAAKDEDAQLQTALENSRADVFLPPTSRADEDSQLRKALRNSLADPLMPAKPSHDPHEAQLQQAVALSQAEVFTPPANATEEAAQLEQAIKNSNGHTSGAEPAHHDEADAQLQQTLAESRADAFLPPARHDKEQAQSQKAAEQHHAALASPPINAAHEQAQLKYALAQSEAEALEAEHAQLQQAIEASLKDAPEHGAGTEKPPMDQHIQLQLDQLLMQAAMKRNDARKALGEALKALTANT